LGIVASARVAASGKSFADNFNRADGGLGSNWTNVLNSNSIVSNQVAGYNSNAWGVSVWATACDTDDNFSQVTFADYGTAAYPSVLCRASSSANTHYVLFYNHPSAEIVLRRVVAGVETGLGTYSYTKSNGDVLKITAEGSTITAYLNGTNRIQVTDTGITTGKYVGMGGYDAYTSRLDDWSGGDL
jgi:hypothetical protein